MPPPNRRPAMPGSSPAMTARASFPRKRGPMITAGGVPALAALGRDDDRSIRAKHQPPGVRNHRRGNFIVVGLLFTMAGATPACRGRRGLFVTPYVTHDVSPSVVIMCFAFEAPMPTRRI